MDTIFPKNKYLYTDEVIKARNYKFSGERCWWKNHNNIDFILPYNRADTLFEKRKEFFMNCNPGYIYIHTTNSLVSHFTDKIKLDNDFGFIVGIYLANGWSTKTFVGINKNNNNIRKRVSEWCDKYKITIVDKYRKDTSDDLKIHSTLLARMLKIICGTGSENKVIPSFSYTAPNDFIKGLIDGYFSGDGTINIDDGSIICSSVSENLILGVSFLLSYLGIFGRLSSIQPKQNNIGSNFIKKVYTLRLSNNFAKTFAKEINLTENNKQEKLQTITINKNYLYDRGQSQIDYPKFLDVYFDKIISVDYVDGSTEFVYDLTVEKTKNFQLYSGLNLRDTFHKAGQSEKSVTVGVPRFQELLNATKTPKMINCKIFLKEGYTSIQELRETAGNNFVCLTLKDLLITIEVCIDKEEETWYDIFKTIYNDNFSKHNHCISIKLNSEILFKYKINVSDIVKVIESQYDDLYCVFSPLNNNQLDIFVDTTNIKFSEEKLLFVTEENANEIYLEECVQPILEKMIICGIPGIKSIYFTNENNEWFIETDGSNFQTLLGHPIVNMEKLHSNNVWDIFETLGIEAAREFLIQEFLTIMDGIQECHVKLLVEKMTYSGTISSISRYTLRKDESGPMAKSSFEESTENYLKSAFNGDIERIKGVSASIICGKRALCGTGFMDLKIDIKQLKNAIPVFMDKNNDGLVIEKKAISKIKNYPTKI